MRFEGFPKNKDRNFNKLASEYIQNRIKMDTFSK